MSAQPETRPSDKQVLLMRAALCRLRLWRATHHLRESLQWKRVAIASVGLPAVNRLGFDLAVSVVGIGRAARLILLAGRIVRVAKLACSAIDYARHRIPALRPRTDQPPA